MQCRIHRVQQKMCNVQKNKKKIFFFVDKKNIQSHCEAHHGDNNKTWKKCIKVIRGKKNEGRKSLSLNCIQKNAKKPSRRNNQEQKNHHQIKKKWTIDVSAVSESEWEIKNLHDPFFVSISMLPWRLSYLLYMAYKETMRH